MTISDLLGIYYPSNFGCFGKTGVFQQAQAITLIDDLMVEAMDWYLLACAHADAIRNTPRVRTIKAQISCRQQNEASREHSRSRTGVAIEKVRSKSPNFRR